MIDEKRKQVEGLLVYYLKVDSVTVSLFAF